jgi:DNA-binding PadR family transcriptional regulator
MAAPILTTRAALLQALRSRGGYGLDLVRRLGAVGVQVAEARVYPTLRELEAEGLLESVRLSPKGRRGARARIYYHLTPAGLATAEAQRRGLLALLAGSSNPRPSERERARMAERILEAEELSQSGEELRLAVGR